MNRKQVRQETAEQKTGHARCNRTEDRSCKRQQNRRKQVMQTTATQKTVHACRNSRKQDRSCKGQQNTAKQKAGHARTGEHEAGGNLMVERTVRRSCRRQENRRQVMPA